MITKYRNIEDREIYMELYQFFLRSQNTVDEQTMAQLQKKLEDAIECGFDLNYTPSNSFISLYELALIHNPQFAIAMLDGWLDIDSKTSDEKSLFLQTAKYANDVTVFEKALSQTKEINFISPGGETALGALCQRYIATQQPTLLSCISKLLKAGADPNLDKRWKRKSSYPKVLWAQQDGVRKRIKFLEDFIESTLEQKNALQTEAEASYDYEL